VSHNSASNGGDKRDGGCRLGRRLQERQLFGEDEALAAHALAVDGRERSGELEHRWRDLLDAAGVQLGCAAAGDEAGDKLAEAALLADRMSKMRHHDRAAVRPSSAGPTHNHCPTSAFSCAC
jgi:hypothetical protein